MNRVLAPDAHAVGLVATNSPDYFRKFFDCLARGIVVVPLRSEQDFQRIDACDLSEIIVAQDDCGWIDQTGALEPNPRIAQIAFTSGTQGEPKGVMLTHANLADTVARLQSVMDLDSTIREYVGVPVYHSFGFGRCRAIAAAGGNAYLPREGFNLREICAMLAEGEINAISAVPSLWRTVLRHGELIEALGDRVRWIEIGSQPMSRDEKLAMRTLFPHARIIQHYGLTEASRATFLDIGAANVEELDSVGAPVGNVEVAISEAGRIRLRGDNVARELLISGRRVTNTDAEGWFETGDLGRMHDQKLYFLGRADDVINCAGMKISADLLETEIRTAIPVGSALCAARIPDPERGDGVLLAVTQGCACTDEQVTAAAAEILQGHGISALSSIHVLRVPDFPRTDSGKIRRRALVDEHMAAQQTHKDAAALVPTLSSVSEKIQETTGSLVLGLLGDASAAKSPSKIHALYQEAFPARSIKQTDSFVRLGGDSLNFVELSISLEELLGRLPEGWQNLTVREIEDTLPKKHFVRWVDTTLFMRFTCIISIVTFHFTENDIGGATFLLLAIAGFNFSRFQLENILATDKVTSVLVSAARIAIPMFLVTFSIQARHGDFSFLDLALLGNYENAATQDLDYWFIEVMIQVLLIMAFFLSFSRVRAAMRKNPMAFSLALLLVLTLCAKLGPLLWDTAPLYDRVPHMLMWLFVLGWVVQRASGVRERLIAGAMVLILPLLVWGFGTPPSWIAHGQVWVLAGGLFLLFFDKVPVVFPLNKLIFWIGGASMFIYITHWSVLGIWHRIAGAQSQFLDIGVAILAGVLIWILWENATRRFMRYGASRHWISERSEIAS